VGLSPVEVSLAHIAAAFAFACVVVSWSREADASCRPTRVLSEVRRARWLVDDEVRAVQTFELDRESLREAGARLGEGEAPAFRSFAASYGTFQLLGGDYPLCVEPGAEAGAITHYSGIVTAGTTHTASGLELRLSAMGAYERLGEAPLDASSTKSLYTARVGHERWGNVVLGYVDRDRVRPHGPRAGMLDLGANRYQAAGLYYGVSLPALYTNVFALSHGGTTEIVSLSTDDIPLPGGAIFVGAGSTYIREEGQVVGLLRLGVDAVGHRGRQRRTEHDDEGNHVGPSTEWDARHGGPVLEASVESRTARLRHARARWEIGRSYALRTDGKPLDYFRGSAYVEGTAWNSLAFAESIAEATGEPRGPAFGGGLGTTFVAGSRRLSFGIDSFLGANRPEVLAIVPSAQGGLEVRFGLFLRFSN
jgi:hypothetical protein